MSGFQEVAIGKLKLTPLNPRRRQDPQADRELLESVKAKGILVPLTVRKKGGVFEIAAGSRRYRAAKEAGLKTIPAFVKELSDEEFREIALEEQAQHAELHALDFSDALAAIQEARGLDLPSLAERVKKHPKTVGKYLGLQKLGPEGRKALDANRLSLEAAFLLARLGPETQKEALKHYRSESLSAQDIRHYVQYNLRLLLSDAGFDLNDAELLPKAGACAACPKRTGAATALFSGFDKTDRCMDAACFDAKVAAQITRRQEEYKAKGEPVVLIYGSWESHPKKGILVAHEYVETKAKACPTTIRGIDVTTAQVRWICKEPNCKVHGRRNSTGRAAPKDADSRLKTRVENVRKEEPWRVRATTLQTIRPAVEALTQDEELPENIIRMVAETIWDRLWHEHKKTFITYRGWEKAKDIDKPVHDFLAKANAQQTWALIVELVLYPQVESKYSSHQEELNAVAKQLLGAAGIEAIRKRVAADVKAKIEGLKAARQRSKTREIKKQKKAKGAAA